MLSKSGWRGEIAITLLTAVCGCSEPVTAASPDWYRVSIDQQLSLYFVDATSIYNVYGMTRVWTAYRPGIKAGLVDTSENAAYLVKYLQEFDCSQRKLRILNLRTYTRDGRQLSNEDINDKFTYILPGSPQYASMNAVCYARSSWDMNKFERVPNADIVKYYSDWVVRGVFGDGEKGEVPAVDAMAPDPPK